jgi:hypothetical protein
LFLYIAQAELTTSSKSLKAFGRRNFTLTLYIGRTKALYIGRTESVLLLYIGWREVYLKYFLFFRPRFVDIGFTIFLLCGKIIMGYSTLIYRAAESKIKRPPTTCRRLKSEIRSFSFFSSIYRRRKRSILNLGRK